ncbi:ABC-three component system middle component 2 [Clostridium sp.]|uniref:ABC-three component system middle component 2 n=1 Tax=Clostridium sp. TaxID=1506 RepID=UPI00290679C4|nr:ABC-three component system middle component 2 [Clostridium sp.]MDU5107635.1 ABC-three component system middle component 2 [Clostridium sp.]
MNESKIYNTPVEIGVRLLMIIVKNKIEIDFDKLLILDYLSLHSNLINDNFKSLHPDNPFHGLEVYSKMNISKSAIDLLVSKGLIDVKFTSNGIVYSSNSISEYFLSFFECDYYKELEESIEKIIGNFNSYNSNELQEYVFKNIDKWNGNSRSLSVINQYLNESLEEY